MRVPYRVSRRHSAAKLGEPVYETAEPVVCCCDLMAWQWGRLIAFGAPNCRASTSREVNLATLVAQASGKPVLEFVPIDFCPFCGEPIEVCRVK